MSRVVVAKALGVTQTQLVKYELGINRLKANAIPILASLFYRNVEEFFDEDPSGSASGSKTGGVPRSLLDAVSKLQQTVDHMERAANVVKTALSEVSSQKS